MSVGAWDEIDRDTQDALLEWYNVAEPTDDDRELLARLNEAGGFDHRDCGNCGEKVLTGRPDAIGDPEWHDFQGAQQSESFGELCGDCYGQLDRLATIAGIEISL